MIKFERIQLEKYKRKRNHRWLNKQLFYILIYFLILFSVSLSYILEKFNK